MKKVLFCLQTMVLGGVEKELITILKRMPPNEYNVTVLVFYTSDVDIMKQIPEHVKIIDLNIDKNYYCSSCFELCKRRIRKGKVIEAGEILLKRFLGIGMTHVNINMSEIPFCEDRYDTAICYHMHAPLTLRFVAEKIEADKKIVWIHNDFKSTKFPVDKLKKYLDRFQEIIAVSYQVEKEFMQMCPEYREKLHLCHNIVDVEEIVQKSDESITDEIFTVGEEPKLLTVGRFTHQKAFDIAIKAAQILKRLNVKFKWFFIGAGELETEYRKLINEYNVEDKVFILGKKNNPYPYIKNCDIYIQPSRHEAYSIVMLEAKVLHRPIICSRFAGAEEQIIDQKNGCIVSLENVEELAETIEELLRDIPKRTRFIKELQEENREDGWENIKNKID